MNRKKLYASVAVAVLVGAACAGWKFGHGGEAPAPIVLHGNVDLRQVDLPFNAQQRVAVMSVNEGDRVTAGQLVASLETHRLQAALDEIEARIKAQKIVIERLDNGTRPEEIAQARANVDAAQIELDNATRDYNRIKPLAGTRAASAMEVDSALSKRDAAAARLQVSKSALELALAGPRVEDRAEARATLAALEAQSALRRRELADTELRSPVNGIVRNRILEPGEMASPGAPALTIAITDPKWIRAYVSETDLGKVKPGTVATITVDAYPGRKFDGWIGYISPVAEFTPKNVETAELRTALMYEVRVYFKDAQDELRLGMPATVEIKPDAKIATETNVSQPNATRK
jgi:HlyD family secretion protein